MPPRSTRDRGARFLLVVACLVVVIAGLKAASSVFLPFLIAVFLSMITLPLLNWLQSVRVPRALAVPATITVALLVLGAVAFVLGGSIKGFTEQAPKYKERLDLMTTGLLHWVETQGINVSDQVRQILTNLIDPARALDLVTGTLKGITAVFSNLLLVLLTIVFILSEAAGFPAKLERAFGRRESSERFDVIRQEVQQYLGIKTLISLVTGSVVAAAMAIIGVDFPLLWGMLAFILNFIPAFGSILAAIPPTILAIVQLGPGHAIGVVIVFLVINIVLGNLVEPHFMGRRLGLSTLVVFLSLMFWGWVWGPVGMLLSVPLTMVVKIMLEHTEDLRWVAVLLDAGPGRRFRSGADGQASPDDVHS
jgi:predicted PurR-regulated permease PerM